MWDKIASKQKKKLWWGYSLGPVRAPKSSTHPEGWRVGGWGGFPKAVVPELSFKELVGWKLAVHSGNRTCTGVHLGETAALYFGSCE